MRQIALLAAALVVALAGAADARSSGFGPKAPRGSGLSRHYRSAHPSGVRSIKNGGSHEAKGVTPIKPYVEPKMVDYGAMERRLMRDDGTILSTEKH